MSFAFSCLADSQPRFYLQAMILHTTLQHLLQLPPDSLFLHYTRSCDPRVPAWFAERGARTFEVEPYDAASPPCNKIRQFDAARFAGYGHVVFSDCDKVYLPAFLPWIRGDSVLAAPFVSRPPFRVFEAIFAEVGWPAPRYRLVTPDRAGSAGEEDARTLPGNVNGGTYVMPARLVGVIEPCWRKWIDWLLGHRDVIGRWRRNIDQVAFALAMHELGLEVAELPKYFDLGTNVRATHALPDGSAAIGALHYHDSLLATGEIHFNPEADASLRRVGAEVNALVRAVLAPDPLFAEMASCLPLEPRRR